MRDEILKILDEALEKSSIDFQNVIIMGSTGSGKTSLIKEWFNKHPEIKQYCFLANTRFHESKKVKKLDGTETQLGFGFYFCTDEVDKFNNEGTVLFIDYFDLTHDDARAHLLELVKNRNVVYNLDGEIKHVDNLKMVIAAAFPLGEAHFAYKPLTEKDIEAFDYVINIK